MEAKRFNPQQITRPQISPSGETYTFAGICAACTGTVFHVLEKDGRPNEPDPRGFAGPTHSVVTFEDYPGPLFCWDCVNEHGHEGWKRCEAIARTQGRELTPDQVASVKDRMARSGYSEAREIIMDQRCTRIVVYYGTSA